MSAHPQPSRAAVLNGRARLAALLGVALFQASMLHAQIVLTWNSGDILNATTGLGATLSVPTLSNLYTVNITTTSSHTFDGRAVVNDTTTNWSGGSLLAGNGGTFTNTATFNDTSTGTFGASGAGGATMTFTNAATGVYNKQSAGTKDTGAAFTNAGLVNVDAGAFQFNAGGSSSGTIDADAGTTVRFTNSFSVPDLGKLLGAGTYELTGGTLSTGGILNSVTFNQSGGTLSGSSSIGSGAIYNWTAGNWNSSSTTTIETGGVLNVSSTADHDFNTHALVVNGTTNWTAGRLRSGNAGSITVAAGGTFNDSASNAVNNDYGGTSSTFTNNGTYNKTAAGTTTFSVPFSNTSAVNVTAGTLSFNGGGTVSSTGSFNVSSGAALDFSSGTTTLANGASLNGTGTFTISGGILSLASGTATATGNIMLAGGDIGGTGTLTTSGLFNWTSGDLSDGGLLNANGGGAWSSTSAKYLYNHSINLDGTTTWSAGPLYTGGGSLVTIKPGGTFTTNFDGYAYYNLGGNRATFDNQGTFTKSAGTGTATFDSVFNNSGVVNVQAGRLALRGGGTATATSTFSVASGATLAFDGGTHALASGSSLTGAGSFSLESGTLAIATGTANITSLAMSGGIFDGAGGTAAVAALNHSGGSIAVGTLNLSGNSAWSGGDWDSAAASSATLASGATLALSGSYRDFDHRALVNNGTINWTSGYLRSSNGGALTNAAGATFNDFQTSGYSIQNPSFGGTAGTFVFTNNGTYVRNGANTTYIDIPFRNNGAVSVLQGDLQFRSGGSIASTATISAATGTDVYFTEGFTVSNGTSLTGAGTYWLTGGIFDVAGTLNASTFNQTGGTLANTNVLNGLIRWSGGDWNAATGGFSTTIASGATLTLDNGGYHDFNRRAIVNQGTVNWSSGYIRSSNGGSFTNAAGATFYDLNVSGYTLHNPGLGGTTGTFVFTNNGTYVRNAANTSYLDVPFDNNGTVSVLQGNLQFRSGGTLAASGTIAAASGTNVYFTDGYTVSNGASLTGTGGFWLTGGVFTLTGQINVATFNQTGGNLGGTGTINGTFNWNGGDWNASAAGFTTTIASGGTLNLSNGGYHDFNRRAIVNQGTVNWVSGYIRSSNGSAITNAGIFDDQNSSGYTIHNPGLGGTAGTFVFTNDGTYLRHATGTTYFDTTFNNNGTLNLQQGDIQIRQGGTMSATSVVHAATGTNLYFTNDYTLQSGATFAGPGTFIQSGGTLALNGTLQASNFNWSGGDWNGTGTTVIDATTTLNLGSGGYKDFTGRTIVNQGVVNWQSGYLRGGNGSAFTNAAGATFSDQNVSGYTIHNPFGGTFSFANAGTYVKNSNSTTSVQIPFTNTGTLLVQAGTLAFTTTFTNTGGSLIAAGGNFSFSGGLNVGTGSLAGTGTITAPTVTAGGLVSPGNSPGQLTIAGNLTLLNTSTTLFELGGTAPGTGYDFLNVTGSAALDGTLQVKFVNNFNTSIQSTDTFTLLATASRTGTFANAPTSGLRIFSTDGLASFQVNYSTTALILSNFEAVPEPSTWALLLAGTLLVALQRRRRAAK